MTTRPSLGGPQRQPQRSLSANIIQRPTPNRTLSQQFPPSSPVRRNNEAFGDLSFEAPDVAPGRYGTLPREGSRLKLEIGKDSRTPSFVESPRPADLTPTWRPSQPPRGRPQLHFDVPSVSNLSPRPAQDGGGSEVIIKPMPLPVRPGQHVPPTVEKTRPIPVAKKDVRPKPFALETPTAAPHFSPNGRADFFPWTGNHPEDHYTETAIRHGYFDKSQMSQNETGSGKAPIYAKLKDRGGLQTLSSLFTTVLVQRRSHGQITSGSTFKPPPRVTVTDTKRETWLKDLANSTIPLRRLSRSIPHGIRGKVLLDQSLSKNIPIERAVWLAKCVGANELRSSRRRGANGTFSMGGETKWIRDFTVCVEQFVESIVGACGEKDFRSRINYAIRLATHFHAEHLLEREHYMDWLVSSLENTPQAKLPMWLLIIQVYWKDLLRYRKFGRRLATALLTHLAEVTNHPDADILAPLSDRLKSLVNGILVSSPENFISPRAWARHRDNLESIVADEPRYVALFSSIDVRNSQLVPKGSERATSSRRKLINRLDGTLLKPFPNGLAKDCWSLDDDKQILTQTLLEWATSSHRPGPGKIYIAVRILRQWNKYGATITYSILTFLDSKVCEKGRNRPALYHLISELVRSEHFSTSTYLQWLIARGGIYCAEDLDKDGPCATRLLAELPTHNLTENMVALRISLLHRVGFSVEDEEQEINAHEAFLIKSLPGMQSNEDFEMDLYEMMTGNNANVSYDLSRTVKSEMGLWLRQKVRLQMIQPTIPPLDDWDDSPTKGGTSAITTTDFNTTRRYLEGFEDYSMLADVLKTVTSSNDPDVLASCVETLNLHLDVFSAIGALGELFEALLNRMRSISGDDSFPRVLLVSLSDLAARVPEQNIIAQQLAQELMRSDRKTAADACSPVSDQMAGAMQTAEADFTVEIEAILASGNSMDQATLERLFRRISSRLEESWEKLPEQHRSCGLLLTRLRTFDSQQFDLLMVAWVKRFLNMDHRPSMIQVFGPLISFGCLLLKDVATVCTSEFTKSSNPRVSQEMLSLLVMPSSLPDAMTEEEMYRLRTKQSQMQIEQPLETISIIQRAFKDSLAYNSNYADKKSSFNSLELYELLQRLVVTDSNLMTKTLIPPCLENDTTDTNSIVLVDRLLTANSFAEKPLEIPVEMVLGLADDFNLTFCQLKLSSMLSSTVGTDADSEETITDRLQAFDKAIESAVVAENTTWTSIIPLLDISIAQHMRNRAETKFLSLFPSLKTITEDLSNTESNIKQAENSLFIVDATAYSISKPSPNGTLASEIVTTFNNSWQLISNMQKQNTEFKEAVITKWLPLLLSFTTIQASAFDTTKSGHESRARTLLALAAILLELLALETITASTASLIDRAFDLGLQLVDILPDDMRQQCIRGLRDTTFNPRIAYLFSIAPNPSEWLVLSSKEKVGGVEKEKLTQFPLRRWEMLGEPTPNVGENDTSLSLTLFGARRG